MWLALLGLVNGIIMGLVYSIEELWFGIFFCLVPLAGILLTKKSISGFLIGYGLGYYITGLSFLYTLTGVVPLPTYTAYVLFAAAILAVSAVLTLLMWLAVYPIRYWRRGKGSDIFLLAALYALGEWFQEAVPFVSFPWFRLAAAATSEPVFIQGASLFGSLFVSFLIVLWNAVLARILIRRRLEGAVCMAVALIIAVLLYGEVRLYQSEPADKQVLILQGNHEGSEKWALKSDDILADYERLIYEYADDTVSLVILPETALPYAAADCASTTKRLLAVSRKFSTEILLGAIQREEREGQDVFYNAVYHVTEKGIDEAVYRKQILVPFGEYLPFAPVFEKFCPWLLEFMTGNYFEPGTEQVVFDTKAGRAGVLICYESIFPEAAGEAVRRGAQLLVVVSNDSWFQDTPAMREHHSHAVLRAVEEDRYVLRAGNTGISSVIDNRGRVTAGMLQNIQGGFRAAAAAGEELTVYARIGKIIPEILFGFYILLILGKVCILIFSLFSDIIKRMRQA